MRALMPMLVALAAAPAAALGQTQMHEVATDFDFTLATQNRTATVAAVQYTFTPAALDRKDPVAPSLRRFVRHPSALWGRIERVSASESETRTSIHAGGFLDLVGGRLFVSGQAGFEQSLVNYDDYEDAYYPAPLAVQAGGRPHPLLAVAAVYRLRPILASSRGELQTPATRSGREHEVGGTITAATPTDRLLASLSARYVRADLDFAGFHPGTITRSGARAEASFSVQSSASMSWLLGLAGKIETWRNRRLGDGDSGFVGERLDRRVYGAEAQLGILYWYRGELGFRVSLMGGFETAPPLYYYNRRLDKDRAYGGLGMGIVSRW